MDEEDLNGAEMDSDPDNELDAWLGQLNDLKEDLGSSAISPPVVNMRKQITPSQTLDSFRFSVIQGVEENQDIDLDALLGELCAIGNQLDTTTGELTNAINTEETAAPSPPPQQTQEQPADDKLDFSFLDDDLADFSSEIDIVKLAFGISNTSVDSGAFVESSGTAAPPFDSRPNELPVPPPPLLLKDHESENDIQTSESVHQGQRSSHGPTERSNVMQVQSVNARPSNSVEVMDGLEEDGYTPSYMVDVRQSQNVHVTEGQRSEVMDGAEDRRVQSIQDNSSYSDSMSLMSESSGISGESGQLSQEHDKVLARLECYQQELVKQDLPSAEQEQLLKKEKIKIAMEKIKEANIKKLFVRAFAEDGSTKSIMADETMTCRDVLNTLLEKNHYRDDITWSLIEEIPELYMERVYEDNEMLVDNMLLWTADSVNKVLLTRRQETYDVFLRPEEYLLGPQPPASSLGEEARKQLLESYFQDEKTKVPELDGEVYLKAEGKKAWKKYHCVLRESGIFYNPKGKGKSSKDLQSLAHVEVLEIYRGLGWKKKYKAPTDYGFALKHPQIQKKSKYIKYMCVEDERTLRLWITGLRIAKHGHQLYTNFKKAQAEIRKQQAQMRESVRSNQAPFSPPDVSHKPPVAVVMGISQRVSNSNFVDIDSNTTARIPLTTGTTRHLVRGGCSTSSSGDSGIGREEFHDFPPPPPPDPDFDMDFPPPPPMETMQPPVLTPTPDIPPKSGHLPSLVAELQLRKTDGSHRKSLPRSGIKTSSRASSSSEGADYDNPVSASYSPRTSASEYSQQSSMISQHHRHSYERSAEAPPVARKPASSSGGSSPSNSLGRPPPPVAKKPSPEPPPVARKPLSPPAVASKPKPVVPVRGQAVPVKPYMVQEHEAPRVAPKPGHESYHSMPGVPKPQPPPPPKRIQSEKQAGGAPANKAFLTDLESMFAGKRTSLKTHGVNPERVSTGEMDLPPPPPELLEGLPPKMTKKKPPPPPKRNT